MDKVSEETNAYLIGGGVQGVNPVGETVRDVSGGASEADVIWKPAAMLPKGGGAIFLQTGATPSSSEPKSRGKKRSKQSCEQSIRSDGTLELSFGTKNSGMNIICYQFWIYDGLNGNGQRYLAQSCPAIICSHKNQQEKALTALLCYVYRNR